MKVNVSEHEASLDLVIEGRVTGMSVQELVDGWGRARRRAGGRRLRVDSTNVTFVGRMGKQLLQAMDACGCELACTDPENALAQEILAGIHE